jgi:hypothetical protein
MNIPNNSEPFPSKFSCHGPSKNVSSASENDTLEASFTAESELFNL